MQKRTNNSKVGIVQLIRTNDQTLESVLVKTAHDELNVLKAHCEFANQELTIDSVMAVRLSRAIIATICRIGKTEPERLSNSCVDQLDKIDTMLEYYNGQFSACIQNTQTNPLLEVVWDT